MKHEHCEHKSLKYCQECKVAYCTDCEWEFGSRYNYSTSNGSILVDIPKYTNCEAH